MMCTSAMNVLCGMLRAGAMNPPSACCWSTCVCFRAYI